MKSNCNSMYRFQLLPLIIKAARVTENFHYEATSSDTIENNRQWKSVLESGLKEIDFITEEVPEFLYEITKSLKCFYEHDREYEKAFKLLLTMGRKLEECKERLNERIVSGNHFLTQEQIDNVDPTGLVLQSSNISEKVLE